MMCSSFTNGVVTFDDHVPASGDQCMGIGNSPIVIGISEFDSIKSIHVEPDPNNGQFFLSLESSAVGLAVVEIMDATGKRVFQRSMRVNGSAVREPLDLGSVAKGIYMLKLSIGGTTYKQRVAVQ